jgi:hypothetical protein
MKKAEEDSNIDLIFGGVKRLFETSGIFSSEHWSLLHTRAHIIFDQITPLTLLIMEMLARTGFSNFSILGELLLPTVEEERLKSFNPALNLNPRGQFQLTGLKKIKTDLQFHSFLINGGGEGDTLPAQKYQDKVQFLAISIHGARQSKIPSFALVPEIFIPNKNEIIDLNKMTSPTALLLKEKLIRDYHFPNWSHGKWGQKGLLVKSSHSPYNADTILAAATLTSALAKFSWTKN